MVYFRLIFLMIIVVAMISLQCCSLSADGKEIDERYWIQIGKLVGEDGGEKKTFTVLEKFIALLGLIKPSASRRRNFAASAPFSPWPRLRRLCFQTVVRWSLRRTLGSSGLPVWFHSCRGGDGLLAGGLLAGLAVAGD
ncbi:hypothetical protein Bca4012_060755 [Brassica carinata]|uniref:Uncharacterized protein n=1 Tax=Brassica carinata TaxID=52824 RepID=A0A8X7V7D7_BRACI|nr:hypothetical protein Bca52824_031102 [Brassica carinata]